MKQASTTTLKRAIEEQRKAIAGLRDENTALRDELAELRKTTGIRNTSGAQIRRLQQEIERLKKRAGGA
jgi:predicted RNase H-like nuclease (RuvC/YqgF family)